MHLALIPAALAIGSHWTSMYDAKEYVIVAHGMMHVSRFYCPPAVIYRPVLSGTELAQADAHHQPTWWMMQPEQFLGDFVPAHPLGEHVGAQRIETVDSSKETIDG